MRGYVAVSPKFSTKNILSIFWIYGVKTVSGLFKYLD